MRRGNRTTLGGPNEAFEATDWSAILRARTEDPARRRDAVGGILGRYWKPVYGYLRRKGYPNDDAKDLTQGFFAAVVLGRGLVQRADPARGRFRTFLLTALDRYATSVRRAKTARKRAPAGGLVSLDGIEGLADAEPAPGQTPEQAFHHAWAAALLDRVLAEVREACATDGKAAHWSVFDARVVRPILEGTDPPPLPGLCVALRIADEAAASNMIVTVKRRFQAALRRHVAGDVAGEADVDAEIRDLMAILARAAGT